MKWTTYKQTINSRYLKYFKDCNKVLDIGAYEGQLVKQLRACGKTAKGIDLNQQNEYVVKGNAKDLPFPDSSFDCVSLIHLAEHLQPPELIQVIDECGRVLADDGKIIIATPTVGKWIWDDATHVRPYSWKALRHILEQPEYVGAKFRFKIQEVKYQTRLHPILRGVFYRLGLFGFYKKAVYPVLNILGLGNRELVVVAVKEAKK